MSLDNIVSVSITRATASVTRAGFGTPLIMSSEAKGLAAFAAIYAKEYASLAEIAADLFSTTGVTYTMATAIFSQSPKVASVVIGKRSGTLPTMIEKVDLIAAAAASTVYSLEINGTAFSVTSDLTPTLKEVIDAFTTAINASSVPVTASDDDITLTLTADVAGALFTLELTTPTLLKRQNTTIDPAGGVVADLTAIRTSASGNDDWYCVLLDSQGEAEIEALAAHIETLPRIFLAASGDYNIKTSSSTDVAADLETSAYDRTALIYHPNPHERPDCAWAGKCLPLDPGSETWKFKTLAGVPVTTLLSSERAFIVGKGCNVYELVAGNNITAEGTMASGEFIDNMRFIDFITARIKENVFLALLNASKIPFTDKGVAVIVATVQGVLDTGVAQGGFASDPAPTVEAPLVADVDDSDRADRLLPDVTFGATLAGAIHRTTVSGVISV